MRHLAPAELAGELAASTGRSHLALEVAPGTDLSDLQGIIPQDAIEAAGRTGSTVLVFHSGIDAYMAYDAIERRMSSFPGGTITLAQADGETLTRSVPSDSVVTHDFTRRRLPMAA
jgi:hypothetical protein